jgi:hypothetical protein
MESYITPKPHGLCNLSSLNCLCPSIFSLHFILHLFQDINYKDSIEEVEGYASLSENKDSDYVGVEENN